MEHSTSAVNWQPVNVAKRPGELARDSLTHVAHGADAVCFFQWRQSAAGAEKYHSAMVPHAGADSEVFRAVDRARADAADAGPGRRRRARAGPRSAILFDWESWWASEQDSHPTSRLRYRQEALDWYSALLALGVRADVVTAQAAARRLRARDRADAARRPRRAGQAARRGTSTTAATSSPRTSPASSTRTTTSGSAATRARCAICSASAIEEFGPLLDGDTVDARQRHHRHPVDRPDHRHRPRRRRCWPGTAPGTYAGRPADHPPRRSGRGSAAYVSTRLGRGRPHRPAAGAARPRRRRQRTARRRARPGRADRPTRQRQPLSVPGQPDRRAGRPRRTRGAGVHALTAHLQPWSSRVPGWLCSFPDDGLPQMGYDVRPSSH